MVPWIWIVACLRAGRFPRTSLHPWSNYISSTRDWRRNPAQKNTLTVWIDLQKAFDKVWTVGLILKLKKCNIARNLLRLIKSYLHNLRARVVVDNTKSEKILLRHGVPQGGIPSATLSLVFINDLSKKFPSPMKCAMYANNLVLWSTEVYDTAAKIRLQKSNQLPVKLGTRLVCKDI